MIKCVFKFLALSDIYLGKFSYAASFDEWLLQIIFIHKNMSVSSVWESMGHA